MPIRAFVVVLPMLIFLLSGCAAPPTAEADAARQSMAAAQSAGAEKYAATSFKEAEAAQSALDAEMKAQEGKFMKSLRPCQRAGRRRRRRAADKAAADAATATRARGGGSGEEGEGRRGADASKLAKAIRVGGQVRPPIKIKDVAPVYPAIAQSARVPGDVVIEATIDDGGQGRRRTAL